jgi:hypothetical protein
MELVNGSPNITMDIVTRLRAGQAKNRSSIAGRVKRFISGLRCIEGTFLVKKAAEV